MPYEVIRELPITIEIVIFDWDGTLYPIKVGILAFEEAYKEYFEEHNIKFEDYQILREIIRENWGKPGLEIIENTNKKLYEAGINAVLNEHEVYESKKTIFKDLITKNISLIDGAKVTIEILHDVSRYRLAIATNHSDKKNIENILEANGISDYIELIVNTEDTKKVPKPEPDMLNFVLKELRIEKHQAVYVGDQKSDVETANRAGIPGIMIKGTLDSESLKKVISPNKEIFEPHVILSSIKDLSRYLFESFVETVNKPIPKK